MSLSNVLVVSDNETHLERFLDEMFGEDTLLNGENCLEVDVELKSKYYQHQIHLFLDKIGSDELPEWLDELAEDEMRELRDSTQGIVIIVDDLNKVSNLTKELTDLAYKLDDEFVKEGVYQWDGIKSIILLESEDQKTDIDDEIYESFDKSTFHLVQLGSNDPFDELIDIFQATEWRGVEINENSTENGNSRVDPTLNAPSEVPLSSQEELDIVKMMREIKLAKSKAQGDPERANQLAGEIAEQIYKT